MKNFLFLLLLTTFLASCVDMPIQPDFPYVTSQEAIEQLASEGSLGARAVVASGLYSRLAPENYPFMLVQFEDKTLETYVTEQGLSEEAFLTHPKLQNFMEHHLIPSFVDNIKIRSTPNGQFTYISATGSKVVFTTGEDLTQTPERLNVAEVNGVPFNPYCLVSGNGAEDTLDEKGLICWAAGPIVENFDWSQ